jgi:hypothetical protein
VVVRLRLILVLIGSTWASAMGAEPQAAGRSIDGAQAIGDITISAEKRAMLESLASDLAAVLLSGDESSWMDALAPELDELSLATDPHVQARAFRVDLADRRGRSARAQFCNRRVSLSARDDEQSENSPATVPSPGSVALLVIGLSGVLSRRRVRSL